MSKNFKINIIGAGSVGTTLGILLARQGHQIINILSRTIENAERARETIGAGKAINNLSDLSQADVYIVTTSDNALYTIGQQLLEVAPIKSGTIFFHCSGATPSSVLAPLHQRGAHIASVHPIKTFTAPAKDADSFSGTWCGAEGDAAALAVLEPLFKTLNANVFTIATEHKILYHTAIVFMCNYLFSLVEVGMQCYEKAGVPRDIAAKVVEPLLRTTVDNALRLGPGKALTGPIARGDDLVVGNQVRALAAFNPAFEELYKMLGRIATDLSVEKGVAAPEKINAIRKLLGGEV